MQIMRVVNKSESSEMLERKRLKNSGNSCREIQQKVSEKL